MFLPLDVNYEERPYSNRYIINTLCWVIVLWCQLYQYSMLSYRSLMSVTSILYVELSFFDVSYINTLCWVIVLWCQLFIPFGNCVVNHDGLLICCAICYCLYFIYLFLESLWSLKHETFTTFKFFVIFLLWANSFKKNPDDISIHHETIICISK